MAKRNESAELVPHQIAVKTIKTAELFANPHNPRFLFDKEPMDVLRQSIEKVGILVPLTVYHQSKKNRYVILDGQRRWMCAKDLGLATVPVNEVAEPTLVQNIVTMFQIHKLREDWELMPTALKLELLMRELKETNDKRLAALTGLDQAVVQRCKKLLSYSKKYQDLMLDGDPDRRVKADFFIELHAVLRDRFVKSFRWYDEQEFIAAMLERYQARRLKSVTAFRIIKQHINNARKANKKAEISRRLREFTNDKDLPVEHLEIGTATAVAEANAIVRSVNKMVADLRDLDVDSCIGEEEFWKALEKLDRIIRKRLRDAGRRLVR